MEAATVQAGAPVPFPPQSSSAQAPLETSGLCGMLVPGPGRVSCHGGWGGPRTLVIPELRARPVAGSRGAGASTPGPAEATRNAGMGTAVEGGEASLGTWHQLRLRGAWRRRCRAQASGAGAGGQCALCCQLSGCLLGGGGPKGPDIEAGLWCGPCVSQALLSSGSAPALGGRPLRCPGRPGSGSRGVTASARGPARALLSRAPNPEVLALEGEN